MATDASNTSTAENIGRLFRTVYMPGRNTLIGTCTTGALLTGNAREGRGLACARVFLCSQRQHSASQRRDACKVEDVSRVLTKKEASKPTCFRLAGWLTQTGKEQLHTLGTNLRTAYVNDRGLLPSAFNASRVWLRSTDVPRTKQSLYMGARLWCGEER